MQLGAIDCLTFRTMDEARGNDALIPIGLERRPGNGSPEVAALR